MGIERIEPPAGVAAGLPGLEFLRLSIRPGDRLVVKADHPVSDDEFEWIRVALRRAFDGSDCKPPALLVESGASIEVIGPGSRGVLRRWLRRLAALWASRASGWSRPTGHRWGCGAMPRRAGSLSRHAR